MTDILILIVSFKRWRVPSASITIAQSQKGQKLEKVSNFLIGKKGNESYLLLICEVSLNAAPVTPHIPKEQTQQTNENKTEEKQ